LPAEISNGKGKLLVGCMDYIPDNLLVRNTLEGDAESFRLLVDRYRNPLFRLAYRLTKSRDDAEDLAQEAFVRAYENLVRFDQERNFFTWLYTICMNLTINKLKKKNDRYHDADWQGQEESIASSTLGQGELSRELNESEQRIDGKDKKKVLDQILQKIPDEYRAVIILRYQEELSYQEISEVLNISINLAKVRVHRGLEKLRNLFFQEMENAGE
jgi:RNA polymerase sigma-70 factor (ECF subfamily)